MVLSATLTILRRVYKVVVRALFWALWSFKSSARPLRPITDPVLVQPAHVLAEWIRSGKVTSYAVVKAYIDRIGVVNPVLNAVVDDRFRQALTEAREVDRVLASSSPEEKERLATSKPFLGVPFTTKENVRVKGLSHTGGLVARIGRRAKEDAVVVTLMKDAGAIPMCVSNVPELGIWWESANQVYGRTSSAHDISRTPGGSSGGEGALLASCGSPLSVGTDVGGSIRIPAYCSGVYGHKPTSGWVSLEGAGLYTEKLRKGGVLVAGPLGRCVKDLILALQVLAPQDATGLQDKIEKTELSKTKVWWAEELGSPLYSSVDFRLRNLLHRVLHFLDHSNAAYVAKWPLDMSAAYQIWNNKMADDYSGEPSLACDMTDRKGEINLAWEWMLWLVGRGRHTFPTLFQAVLHKAYGQKKKPETSPFYWKTYQEKFKEVLGNDGVLILPVLPIVSPYHNEPILNPFDYCYSGMFNAIEFPSTAVTLGQTSDGCPIGLQIVTTPGNDHLSLAVATALERKFGGWVPPFEVQFPSSSKKDS
ncbi:fatty-acid amide hydrolase 2-like [Penaeus chinensis]|uniref:fatty-acid amide hydrolase 2-like n=1 Tax=Penaeus chinensis TaxID=139456 RepID=UPI001FB7F401|nr:fatty-acid amide hydrolase 2-like [Penaeus chinensis]XP_047474140.1 fatty-acid amide hydrolase 2-like [Penaeus chinensis]